MLTPPTTAASHRPLLMASTARHRASKLEEQAVSTVMLGPGKRKEKGLKKEKAKYLVFIPLGFFLTIIHGPGGGKKERKG